MALAQARDRAVSEASRLRVELDALRRREASAAAAMQVLQQERDDARRMLEAARRDAAERTTQCRVRGLCFATNALMGAAPARGAGCRQGPAQGRQRMSGARRASC